MTGGITTERVMAGRTTARRNMVRRGMAGEATAERAMAGRTASARTICMRGLLSLLVLLACAAGCPDKASAAPGSGTAQMWPVIDAVAGAYNRWTIRYTAAEDFDKDGGMVTLTIPLGWSTPQKSDSMTVGFFRVTIANPDDLDSATVSGRTIRLYLGGRSGRFFDAGEFVEVIYGASSSLARTQTTAQSNVEFTLASDPAGTSPLPLTLGSPKVNVIPSPISRIAIYFGGSEAGALSFTADDNANVFRVRGLDQYGNITGGVQSTWSVTAPIGTLSGGVDSTNTFNASRVGSAYIRAQDGSSRTDSTGLITVTHGAYARLDVAQPDSSVAGQNFAVSVAALDSDGNIVTSGTGSAASLGLSAWRDSLGTSPGTGSLSVTTLVLAGGLGSVNETYFVAESIYVRAEDASAGPLRDFGPRATLIRPAPPSVLDVSPDTLSVAAGSQGALTLTSRDGYGNVSPVGLSQSLYLWTNSPEGHFRQTGSTTRIYDVTMPAGSSQVSFDYYDTRVGEAQIVVMDVDSNTPSFAPVAALADVRHGAAAALVVSGITDPVVAGSTSNVAVEARDGFGNRARNYAGTVEFTSSDGGPQTILPGNYTFAASDSGLHVFSSSVRLTIRGEQSVTATDAAVPSVSGNQAGVTVLAAGADSLLLGCPSGTVSADQWVSLDVEALDEFGNRAVDYQGVVGFSSSDSGDSTALPSPYQFAAADSGLRIFPGAVRLTTVGTHSISIRDTIQSDVDGDVSGLDVTPGVARSIVLTPAGSFNVNAGAGQVVTATARDAFGNLRPGEVVSVVIKDAADGSLADDPANPNNTSGGVSLQSGTTDTAGTITVLYNAPLLSGASDTLDAYSGSVSHGAVVDAFATSIAAGSTALRILPVAAMSDTAGAERSLVVEAVDSFGNIDSSDTTFVRITSPSSTLRVSADGGTTWSGGNRDSLRLASGSTQSRLKVKETRAQGFSVTVEDTSGTLISASKANMSAIPGPPRGAVALSSSSDTLTADGVSVLSFSAGPLTDFFGNSVGAGTPASVSSSLCDILNSDADSVLPGIQVPTAANGKVTFTLRAGSVAGIDTVRVSSVQGSARGSAYLTLLAPARLAYVGGTVSPQAVRSGESVSFSVRVENTGGSRAYLTPSSTFSMTDGNDGSYVAALSETTLVLAGQSATLTFTATPVSALLDPGSYSPLLTLVGRDGTGVSFNQPLQAGVGTVKVVAMRVVAVSATSRVTRGTQDVPVQMTVENEGSVQLDVNSVGLNFSQGGHSHSLVSPAVPVSLAAGEIKAFNFLVDIDGTAPMGACVIDGFAQGVASGIGVADTGADSTATWTVQSPAVPSHVSGSLSPDTVSVGRSCSISSRVLNSGTASVELDTLLTYVAFGPAAGGHMAYLAGPTLLAGGGETGLVFKRTTVPSSMRPDTHTVRLVLGGTENGAVFRDTIFTPPENIAAELPSVIEYVSLVPEAVSTGYAPSFSAEFRNTGQAAVMLLPQSAFSFGSSPTLFRAYLTDSLLIEGDSVTRASFAPSPVDTAFSTSRHLPGFVLSVRENGSAFDTVLVAGTDSVLVQKRALAVWVPGSLTPSVVTAGQSVDFVARVANIGDAALVILPAVCELSFRDGQHEYRVPGLGSELLIPGSGEGVLSFAAAAVSPNMANQSYVVELSLSGAENGLPFEKKVFSPSGELVVQSPPSLRYVYRSLEPDTVAQGQVTRFTLRVENSGDAALSLADSSVIIIGSLTDTVDCSGGCQVPAHGAVALSFGEIEIDSLAVPGGKHAVSISLHGVDSNGLSFSRVLTSSPDSLVVRRPGDLRVSATLVSSPNAPFVDTLQVFLVEVEIENLGEEAAAGVVASLITNGDAGLGGPRDFGTIPGGGKKRLALGATAAPSMGTETVTARIDSATGATSGRALSVAPAVDDTALVVTQTPALISLSAQLSAPSGATDGTVSTDQSFVVSAIVENSGQGSVASGGTVRLSVPPELSLLSPAVQSFSPGVAVQWTARNGGAPQVSLPVSATIETVPPALNTGAASDTLGAGRVLYVEVVEKANLSLSALIVEPVDATDGSVHVGQTFKVEGVVTNSGSAGVAGTGRLSIALPPGYSLAAGQSAEQEFAVGVPVDWDVTAPVASSPIQYVSVTMSGIPLDENTSVQSYVSQSTREIAVLAESKEMVVEVLSLVEPPVQVVGGQTSVSLMAVRIVNREEIGEGGAIGLRAVSFFVTGDDRVRLLNPSMAISAIRISRYSSGAVLGSASGFTSNPVRLEITPADTLAAGESDTLVVTVDVAATPLVGGLAIEIEGDASFEAFDVASAADIGVVAPDGRGFPGAFTPPSRIFAGVHNYPNPFRAGSEHTRISYYLESDSQVSLKIFTLDGRLVFSRTYSEQDAEGRRGLCEILWDGKNGKGEVVLNGVYVGRVEAQGVNATFKIAVAK
ncbi:MAG: hypothetical protein V2A71_10640 [Candidatus Eisenbacteria bacterium]